MSLLSNCCDALPVGGMEESGLCGACKEHCEFWDEAFEATIEQLNTRIDDMPWVVQVSRFDWDPPNFDPPQGECQDPFQCGVNYLDSEVGWLNDVCACCQEDLDYAERCADEKFRSLH